jgi:1-acyl-sn-glycerol-3-phosphate acyltransferase
VIEASRSRWLSRWFSRWFEATATRSIRRTFAVTWVAGLERLEAIDPRTSLLCVANHTAWWDGMVVLALNAGPLRREGFALMDAANLERYRFFRRVGGFGVTAGSRRDGARVLRYAAEILETPGRALWVFPQGAETPAHAPLVFQPGAARLAVLSPQTPVIPVGLRYVFGARSRPELFISLGAPLARPDRPDQPHGADRPDVDAQRDAVAEQLARIDAHLLRPDPGFVPWVGDPARRDDRAARWLDRLVGGGGALAAGSGDEATVGRQRQLAPAPPGAAARQR